MEIRAETVADRAACVEVVTAGFVGDDGLEPIQNNLLRELFVSDACVPELSIVAVRDGVVVGYVITTRAPIVLLGDPDYYRRFGFVRADELGIDPAEDWSQHFMVMPLIDGPLPRGPFEFAEPFHPL